MLNLVDVVIVFLEVFLVSIMLLDSLINVRHNK
jgi:hypothetical protein